MSTSSNIAISNTQNVLSQNYCFWDSISFDSSLNKICENIHLFQEQLKLAVLRTSYAARSVFSSSDGLPSFARLASCSIVVLQSYELLSSAYTYAANGFQYIIDFGEACETFVFIDYFISDECSQDLDKRLYLQVVANCLLLTAKLQDLIEFVVFFKIGDLGYFVTEVGKLPVFGIFVENYGLALLSCLDTSGKFLLAILQAYNILQGNYTILDILILANLTTKVALGIILLSPFQSTSITPILGIIAATTSVLTILVLSSES